MFKVKFLKKRWEKIDASHEDIFSENDNKKEHRKITNSCRSLAGIVLGFGSKYLKIEIS